MTARKALLSCGILSSLLYIVAIDVIAAIGKPQYHSYSYQMVSELFAVGAPTRSLLGPPMIVYNLLVLAFAVGVSLAAGGRRVTRLAAVAVGVYGVISMLGFVVAPMDVRGPGGVTERDVVHIAATAVQGIALVAAISLGGFAHGLRFRLYSFATLITCLGFGALASFFATQEASPWLGSAERVSIYAWMLWVAVFAVAFLRVPAARVSFEAAGP